MIKIYDYTSMALQELGITEWVIRGESSTPEKFLVAFSKVTGKTDDGSAIESADPADWGFDVATVFAKREEIIAGIPLKELREERDKRIVETDWWALSDVTMTPERSAYRQALRDITENYSSLDDVVWPVKPA
jgi:hypothetical protein